MVCPSHCSTDPQGMGGRRRAPAWISSFCEFPLPEEWKRTEATHSKRLTVGCICVLFSHGLNLSLWLCLFKHHLLSLIVLPHMTRDTKLYVCCDGKSSLCVNLPFSISLGLCHSSVCMKETQKEENHTKYSKLNGSYIWWRWETKKIFVIKVLLQEFLSKQRYLLFGIDWQTLLISNHINDLILSIWTVMVCKNLVKSFTLAHLREWSTTMEFVEGRSLYWLLWLLKLLFFCIIMEKDRLLFP
jgi:hypothetical protein